MNEVAIAISVLTVVANVAVIGYITIQCRKIASSALKRGDRYEYMRRDDVQEIVSSWVTRTFGGKTARSPQERASRLLEEAVEMGQSIGLPKEMAVRVVNYVYARPPGDPSQEVGGVAITLLALCGALNISLAEAEADEIRRVLEKDREYFISRDAEKKAAGVSP